nr:rep protein [Cressdnaviricota sp.]
MSVHDDASTNYDIEPGHLAPGNGVLTPDGTVQDLSWYDGGSIWSTQPSERTVGTQLSFGSINGSLLQTRLATAGASVDGGSLALTTSTRGSTASNSNKSRMWLITVLDYNTAIPLTKEMFGNNAVKAITGQYEICPTTGTRHVHLAVEFTNSKRFDALRHQVNNIFGVQGCDIKPVPAADWLKVERYCHKEDSRDPIYERYNVHIPRTRYGRVLEPLPPVRRQVATGSIPRPRKPSKIETVWKLLLEQDVEKSWDEIFAEADTDTQVLMLHAPSTKKQWEVYRQEKYERRTIQRVIILYGAAGSGKTCFAMNGKDYFRAEKDDFLFIQNRAMGAWCDGYKNQEVFLIDEIDGRDWDLGRLLQTMDIGKQGPKLQIKGSSVQGNFHTIVLTSNRHPMMWFQKSFQANPMLWKAFARRITECRFYPPKKNDGTPNNYVEQNEPTEFINEELYELEPNDQTYRDISIKMGMPLPDPGYIYGAGDRTYAVAPGYHARW